MGLLHSKILEPANLREKKKIPGQPKKTISTIRVLHNIKFKRHSRVKDYWNGESHSEIQASRKTEFRETRYRDLQNIWH